jgi:hypothetical protein
MKADNKPDGGTCGGRSMGSAEKLKISMSRGSLLSRGAVDTGSGCVVQDSIRF